jgi:AcrR family transcriptional regulator
MARSTHSAPTDDRSQHPLNRQVILDGAIALIERDGPESLSMRRLGSHLGVEGMAIYHHFAGREELLAAIGDRLLEPLRELEFGTDWRDACRRFAIALRDIAVAQPATFQLLGLQPLDTPAALEPVERLLGVLVDAGFRASEALATYRATVSYARGYALAEVTGFTVDAARPTGRERLAALPVAEFPILAGRAGELEELDPDSAFQVGLEALMFGLGGPG